MTTDPALIESSFIILPGEVRQVPVPIDDRWRRLFIGWITSEAPFQVVEARMGDKTVTTVEVPADVDPRAEEWTGPMKLFLPPGEDLTCSSRTPAIAPPDTAAVSAR